MLWNFYDGESFLRPLEYSNGKSQLDVVNDIIDGFGEHRFVLLNGICGTGKSSIALHCCANFGKSIIVVPTKHLQDQYSHDYSKRMKVHDLKIQFLKGRSNFKCRYEDGLDCNHPNLPCISQLKGGDKRHEVCKCNFWSPIYTPDIAQKIKAGREGIGIKNIEMKTYLSATGPKCQVVRTPSCAYLKQYFSFWDDTNVIVMNDKIWELMITRKPAAEIEVIDEYDNYFDSLYFDEMLSFSRLKKFYPKDDDATNGNDALMDVYKRKMELMYRINGIVNGSKTDEAWSFLSELRDFFTEVLKQHDDASLVNFVDRLDVCLSNRQECDVEFESRKPFGKEEEKIIHIVMPNPFIVIEKLFKNSKRVLLMSATPHSSNVLRDFFRVSPKIVCGETLQPGTLFLMKSNMKLVNHREWVKEDFRKEYYDIYREIIKSIPKGERTLIQSHSLKYSGVIAKEFGIQVDSSDSDYYGNKKAFEQWLNGEFKTLISTKCKRGIDLKDDLCRNIIIDKMPYPDRNDRKFKSIEKRFPKIFNEIYNDIARRSLVQLIARGLRHKYDWVRVYTPDLMVYDKIKKLGVFNIKELEMRTRRTDRQSSLLKAE